MPTDALEPVPLPLGLTFHYTRLKPAIVTPAMRADHSHPDWDKVDLTRDELIALPAVPFYIGVSGRGPDPDYPAGFGEFTYRTGPDGEPCLFVQDIHVFREYRRQGLATAIFLEAERVSGQVLHPNDEQFAAGRLLWLSPNRPFGAGVPNPDGPVHRERWHSDVALEAADLARIVDWVPVTEEELLDGYDPEVAAAFGYCGPRPADVRPRG
jgi:hypothetical protein